MTRFYLRVLLLIFLTYVVGIFIFLALLGGLEQHYFRPSFAAELQDLGEDLGWRLQDKSADEVREEIARLEEERRLVFKIELVEVPPSGSEDLGPSNALYFRPKDAPYLLRFHPDTAKLGFFQQQQGARIFASLLLSGIFILLAALFVVLPLVRKLRLQEQTINAIAEGDLSREVEVDTPPTPTALAAYSTQRYNLRKQLGSVAKLIVRPSTAGIRRPFRPPAAAKTISGLLVTPAVRPTQLHPPVLTPIIY